MRAFVFWVWGALSSLSDGLGAPNRVAVALGLVLLTGVVAAVTAPLTVMVMTHTRDRIVVLQQARSWTHRRPNRAERSRILSTHGIRSAHLIVRLTALTVPLVIGAAFLTANSPVYLRDWPDSGTNSAFEDVLKLADRSPTDTGFIVVFGGLGAAAVAFAYGAARITSSWRLARLSLSYAPTLYAIGVGVGLLLSLTIANPLVLAYAAGYLFWLAVIAIATAIGKAPKTFVPVLLDTSERPLPQPDPAAEPQPVTEVPAPMAPQPTVTAPDPTRAIAQPMPQPTTLAHAMDPSSQTMLTPATPMLRCEPLKPNEPRTIGTYRILGRLGSGAMGTVYLAGPPRGEQVALKVLSPALAHDDDSRRRFFRELHALQQIDSPRIVGVVDSGVVDDMPFIAMTAIDGPDLSSHIRDNGPLDEADLAVLADGLADGLAAVHAQGLVHRDVKPSNIIWTGNGPCLVDFGLAHLGDQTRVTSTGMVIGSPSYVSPERLRGVAATPASDVWNWAACLAFGASGDNLYRSDDPAALWHRILNHDFDADTLARLKVLGPQAYALVHDCLETEPDKRPADGGQLLGRYRQAVGV